MDASIMPFMRIVEMVLILLTGPSGQDVKPSRIQRDTYPVKSAIYAHFHLSELRKQIFKDKALKTAVFKDKDAKALFADALSKLSKQINVKEEALLKFLGNARGIGFWMDAKPKPNQIPNGLVVKGLVVIDFGEGTIGLMELMKLHAKLVGMDYALVDEDGVSIHTFKQRHEDMIIHTAVKDGMLAIALEPKSVKSFVDAKQAAPEKQPDGEFFTVSTSGADIIGMIHAATAGRDSKEANLLIGLFDLRSYKRITGTVAMNKVSIAVDVDPNGAAARILKPGKNNRLAKAFPNADFVGYFISLAEPLELWRFIKGQLSMHLGEEFKFVERVLAEMKREIGIDLEGDLLPNLQGYYQFLPIESLVALNDVSSVFAFQFTSADIAQKNLNTLMSAPNIADEMKRGKLKTHTVYRQKDPTESPVIARKGSSVMIAGEMGRETSPETIGLMGIDSLERMNKATGSAKTIAGAHASLDQFFGRDMPDISILLTRTENRLEASLETKFTPFATWLLSGKPLFAHEANRNKERLMTLYGGLKSEVDKSGGTFPKEQWRLRRTYREFRGWVNPQTGNVRTFKYIGEIGKNTPNKPKVFLLYDPKPFDGKRNVVFLDGSLRTLTEKEFSEQLKKQHELKNGLICDLPEAERQKVRILCKQLGDENFKNRRAARKKLEAMGGTILPILREFENDTDPEVKMTVKKIIDKYAPKKKTVDRDMGEFEDF